MINTCLVRQKIDKKKDKSKTKKNIVLIYLDYVHDTNTAVERPNKVKK